MTEKEFRTRLILYGFTEDPTQTIGSIQHYDWKMSNDIMWVGRVNDEGLNIKFSVFRYSIYKENGIKSYQSWDKFIQTILTIIRKKP